jgi:endonuclease/exonuclease/phosphatase (EEP) superfamily protein YafD
VRTRPLIAWLLAAVAVAWAIFRTFGLERGFPLVPLLAWTPFAAVAAVVAVVIALGLRQRLAALVAVLAAAALVAGVVPRAVGGPTAATGGRGPAIGVLSVNLRRGDADPEAVVALVRRSRADVRLGPQTSGTALFARRSLRPLHSPEGTANPLATGELSVPGADVVVVTAVHPLAPANGLRVAGWRRDYRRLPEATPTGQVRVLAGDFNATLDHHELRRLVDTGYEDAAEQLGSGLRPTWPVGRPLPPVTIDRVLADRRCGFRGYSVRELPGTDHRSVYAEVELPPAAST